MTEQWIPLATASRLIPGKPSLSSLHRWATRGIRGVRLATTRVGARLYTTEAKVAEFLSRQQATETPTHEEAEAELADEGL